MPLSTAVPRKYRSLVSQASAASGVPVKVIAAQIDDESGWNPDATSPTGAQGIAQFEPGTWSTWGTGSPYNPDDAFPAYGKFMGDLTNQYHGDLRDALAAYNAGGGNLPAGYGYADNILAAAGLPQDAHVGAAEGSLGSSPYQNPFRDVADLQPDRIDQGVDYSGSGPVYALGPGRITYAGTGNTGWGPPAGAAPGGYVEEEITAGRLKGHKVYVAEGLVPNVRVGQRVNAHSVIGTMVAPIETGFASGTGTQAAGASQFDGTNSTAYGAAYSKILSDVGAPAGVVQPGGVSGSLPSWLKGIVGGVEGLIGGAGGGAGTNSGVAGALGGIGDSLEKAGTVLEWFLDPTNEVRLTCGILGGALVLIGVWSMTKVGGTVAGVDVPSAFALPVSIGSVGAGALLLFIAFHGIPSGSLWGTISQVVKGQATGAGAG